MYIYTNKRLPNIEDDYLFYLSTWGIKNSTLKQRLLAIIAW